MIVDRSICFSLSLSASTPFILNVVVASFVVAVDPYRQLDSVASGLFPAAAPWPSVSVTSAPPLQYQRDCSGSGSGVDNDSSASDRDANPCTMRRMYGSEATMATSSGLLSSSLSALNADNVSPSDWEPEATDFIENHIATWLWMYVAPALLLIGTFGNVLSLAVVRGCASFRTSSVGFTLSALAVVDTGVLYVPLLRQWLLYLTDYDLDLRRIGGSGGCKLHYFLSYLLSQLSSWTVIVVTIERTVFVALPIMAKVSKLLFYVLYWNVSISISALFKLFFQTVSRKQGVRSFAGSTTAEQRHSLCI
jgi:hypothetical protein